MSVVDMQWLQKCNRNSGLVSFVEAIASHHLFYKGCTFDFTSAMFSLCLKTPPPTIIVATRMHPFCEVIIMRSSNLVPKCDQFSHH